MRAELLLVFDQDGAKDRYTPGGQFTVVGKGFGDLGEVPSDLGLYLSSLDDGELIRVLRYESWTDSEIRGFWPLGLVGQQRLIVETRNRNGMTRSGAYPHPLVPSVLDRAAGEFERIPNRR